MHEIVPLEHSAMARRFRQTLSIYQQNRDLIAIGAYHKGGDPRIDAAIAQWPHIQRFLQQDMREKVGYDESLKALRELAEAGQ
jgi:flagellum-specific ATP synthase